MESQVRRSSLFSRFECTVIPNGVDLDEFYPVERGVARKALGIPEGRKVVAFVAESVKNVRKGFPLLIEAVKLLAQKYPLFLLAVGRPSPLPIDVPSMMLGPIQAVPFLRQIYSAADAYVIASLEDNQPNTVLEAMACGTPVAGFKVGGIPEMVESGETGVLAGSRAVAELAQAIDFLLSHDEDRQRMSIRARQVVEHRFTRTAQVQQYSELYARLLDRLKEQNLRPAASVNQSAFSKRNASTTLHPEQSMSQSQHYHWS
jgi:glycosyltransferase involved in cell wall biosynthesis